VLQTELGLEPTPEVQRLQTEVLGGGRTGGAPRLLRAI